jgi:cyclophilin family peptidyl-prolyl cis-trans isomerase
VNRIRVSTLVVLLVALLVSAACVNPPPPTPVPTAAPAAPTAAPAAPTGASQPTAAVANTPAGAATPVAEATGAPKSAVPVPPTDGSKPLAQIPADKRNNRFSGPAPMSIKPNTNYVATIKTSKGDIVAELYQDTPQSANNFVTLAEDGFYDGLTFHRVEPGFVIQGGDPLGQGNGGPGYTIPAEIKHQHTKGALAWARTSDEVNPQRASSGSQFYITLADTPQLDNAYTVFGQVIEGMDVVEKIAVGDTIKEITISEATASRLPTSLPPTPTRVPSQAKPADGRPLAKVLPEQREKLYTMAPAMTIDPAKTYQATISTPKGNIVIDLDAKSAPNTVNNFVVLSNLGYYDGMPVAFVRPDIFTVFGSPKASEDSDVGYTLEPEAPTTGSKVITGTMTMYPAADEAASKWMASGSQFLLWHTAAPQSDVPLTVLGQVTGGMDIVKSLAANDKVDKIEIVEK